MARAFPDGAYEVLRNEPAGDAVFVEGVRSGTHTGPLATPEGELPATGRRVASRFVVVAAVRDGRIAASRNYHDRLDFLAQLGLLPAPVG